jgi:murein DD-endopeptidase MepM/ murein hydrolase activator NlpD
MNKHLLVLKKITIFLCLKIVKLFTSSFKAIFSKKTILFVSQNKIRSYSINPTTQVVILIGAIWGLDLFVQSLRYDSVIEKKANEISKLKDANQQFEKEVTSLQKNLEKINSYFISISGYDSASSTNDIHQEIEKLESTKYQNIFGDMDLSKDDRNIALKIAASNAILDNIKDNARRRITDLQKKISLTGLALVNNHLILNKKTHKNDIYNTPTEISLNNEGEMEVKQGGPFLGQGKFFGSSADDSENMGTVNIDDEITYLANLEKFIHFAPLSKPMNNYYVSSSYGERTDPIRRVRAVHSGMDFVGREGEKILSPSVGKVIFAGKFGAYGTGIVIDHGYGITTRYGHLAKINVKEGDAVKRGDIIGTQGSTGRSTGSHLHYEVRYKNSPLNPKKFLQAGQAIFNDEQSSKNVDS